VERTRRFRKARDEAHRSFLVNPRENTRRRGRPRLVDTDWLVLRGLRAGIERLSEQFACLGMTALDFGCGTQPYRPLFEDRGVSYRGADFGGAAEHAISPDGQVTAPNASADLVLSFQVLEHVGHLDIYLAEIRRLLKADGRLILSTHGTWLYHPHPEDHRRWTREGLIAELAAHGLRTERCDAVVGPLAWTTLIRLTSFAYVLRKLPLIGSPMAMLVAVIMNARAWVEDKLTPESIRANNACVYLLTARPI
jgi:SAM-dependent methyltransferase